MITMNKILKLIDKNEDKEVHKTLKHFKFEFSMLDQVFNILPSL